jgi:hypothetical protein
MVQETIRPWSSQISYQLLQPHLSSFLHSVQTGSGAHTASYPMGTGGKAAGT